MQFVADMAIKPNDSNLLAIIDEVISISSLSWNIEGSLLMRSTYVEQCSFTKNVLVVISFGLISTANEFS